MKRNWTFAVIALLAGAAAIVFAFLAGKQWNDEPDPDPNEDPNEDPEKKDLNKKDPDGKD
jgi:hypothetical protein